MITQEANLSRKISDSENLQLIESSESLYRLVTEIREFALSLRMIPISDLFEKYKRVVRDLSKELNKQVELEIIGGETELESFRDRKDLGSDRSHSEKRFRSRYRNIRRKN
ncbi:hypothetical protein LEP1GSC116_2580 [Leptospira interrogans serovar Icterohaemorrhagiae str. Verdun HP]|uniref:Uncharacterized protein n=1 Tax=Leptospira interrogans serovar Icterohaemorrhagiae str. Verdun HP TaxID=1049910 RepID=M6RX01_LEPIR|nr:hypothetical protein LEP1GSC116_2580 [Leptospira interrogans serovar Icterohaemorrhagiae str. Verdun HP]